MQKYFFILFIFLSANIFSQNKEVEKNTALLMREETKKTEKAKQYLFMPENQAFTLEELKKYCSDSVSDNRKKAYSYIAQLGRKSYAPEIRQKCVEYLLQSWTDANASIVNASAKYIMAFTRGDFSLSSVDTLKSLLKKNVLQYSKLLRVCGFVGSDTLRKAMMEITDTKKLLYPDVRWSLHLALARCGNPEDIEYCLNRIRKMPVNDNFMYDAAPDLIYTRQKACFDYLVEQIYSDEKNCMSINPVREEPIVCGYIIMEYFAGIVENYPFQKGTGGSLQTKDYKAALATVREWFKTNKEYKISKETF